VAFYGTVFIQMVFIYSAQYKNLIVGIDWTNFFFSLLLAGHSIILLIMRKKLFNGNREVLTMYGFMVFVWFCRVLIIFIEPWPLEPIMWAAYGQQIAAIIIFSLLLIPFIHVLRKKV
jgi:hypothetical protein